MRKTKITILVLLLLAAGIFTNAQVKNDDYAKAVDYLNCKTVELSLKANAEKEDDSKAKGGYENFKNNFPCTENKSAEIIKYLEGIGYSSTANLSKEIDSLKSKPIKEDWKPEDAVEFLSNGVFSDGNYSRISEFAKKRKDNSEFDGYKKDLAKTLFTILGVKPTEISQNSNIQTDEKPKESTPTESEYSFVTLVSWLILVLLVAYVFWNESAMKKVKRSLKILQDRIDASNARINNLQRPQTPAYSSSNTNEINNLRYELDNLKSNYQTLLAKFDQNTRKAETFNRESHESRFVAEPNFEVFYMSTPNKDGTFNKTSAHTTYREGATIYKFTKTIYGDVKFQIDENQSSVNLALAYPEQNIVPVCEAENLYNPNATKIVTVPGGAGKAVLDGDRWKVEQKAVIRYE